MYYNYLQETSTTNSIALIDSHTHYFDCINEVFLELASKHTNISIDLCYFLAEYFFISFMKKSNILYFFDNDTFSKFTINSTQSSLINKKDYVVKFTGFHPHSIEKGTVKLNNILLEISENLLSKINKVETLSIKKVKENKETINRYEKNNLDKIKLLEEAYNKDWILISLAYHLRLLRYNNKLNKDLIINNSTQDSYLENKNSIRVGEIGLDTFYKKISLDNQKDLFKDQLISSLNKFKECIKEESTSLYLNIHNVNTAIIVLEELIKQVNNIFMAPIKNANSIDSITNINTDCKSSNQIILNLHSFKIKSEELKNFEACLKQIEEINNILSNQNIKIIVLIGLGEHFLKNKLDNTLKYLYKRQTLPSSILNVSFETDWPYMNRPTFIKLKEAIISFINDLDINKSTNNQGRKKIIDIIKSNEVEKSFFNIISTMNIQHPIQSSYNKIKELLKQN